MSKSDAKDFILKSMNKKDEDSFPNVSLVKLFN